MDLISCCICQEDFTHGEDIVIVKHKNDKNIDDSKKRGHYFHRKCLHSWRIREPICPLDREPIERVYNVPNYQVLGVELSLFNYDFYNVITNIKLNDLTLNQFDNINDIDRNNKTLAFYACKIGNYPLILKLIKRDADFNQKCGDKGFTPLMTAICNKHIKIVKKLLSIKKIKKGIENYDKSGKTAFNYACDYCFYTIISEFINRELVTKHQVKCCLDQNRSIFNNDPQYGRDIISLMCYYLKSDV